MRVITSHRINPCNDTLSIEVTDEPGAGGANHRYEVSGYAPQEGAPATTVVAFQNGPIAESGVNGITQEVLIAICIDRLKSFQEGPFASRENAVALTHLETAQLWLFKRTLDRMQRGVEGTNQQ